MNAVPTSKFFLIPENLKNDLLTYLMQQPYAQVANGITRLQILQEFIPETKLPVSPGAHPGTEEKKPVVAEEKKK